MAIHTGSAETYDTNLLPSNSTRLDLSDQLTLMSPQDTPLLSILPKANIRGEAIAKGRTHRWTEDELMPIFTTLASAITSAALASCDIAGTNYAAVGDLLRIETASSNEVCLVTAVGGSGTTLTITRGWGTSSAYTHASGARVWIIKNAMLEGADAPSMVTAGRTAFYNYTQIFNRGIVISGSLEEESNQGLLPGVDSEWNYQIQKVLTENVRNLEMAMIQGARSATPSSTVRGTMGGLIEAFLNNNSSWTAISTNATNAATAQLTEATLNGALQTSFENGGSPDTILVNGFNKRVISSWGNNRVVVQGADEFGNPIEVYNSDFGPLQIVLDRYVPRTILLFIEKKYIVPMPLGGRTFGFETLAKTGDASKGQVIGEYTLEIRFPHAHGIIYDLATS